MTGERVALRPADRGLQLGERPARSDPVTGRMLQSRIVAVAELWPWNLRLAAAPADTKLLTVVATSDDVEHFAAGLIEDDHHLRHLYRPRGYVEAAAGWTAADLMQVGPSVVRPSDGGFCLWAPPPAWLWKASLCRVATEVGIFLAPDTVSRVRQRAKKTAPPRINVAHASPPPFLKSLERMLAT